MKADVLMRLREAQRGNTHWEGCEEDHLLCAAIKEIIELREDCAILSKSQQEGLAIQKRSEQ